jgi:Bacterial PH domain
MLNDIPDYIARYVARWGHMAADAEGETASSKETSRIQSRKVFTSQYLMPHEIALATYRKHPAVLLRPVVPLSVVAIVSILLSAGVVRGSSLALAASWLAFGILLSSTILATLYWVIAYVTITNRRIIFVRGVRVRRMNMVALAEIDVLKLRRSFAGRVLGYGELRLRATTQGPSLRRVTYIPYPLQLFMTIAGLLVPEIS